MNNNTLQEIIKYKPAQLSVGKEWFVFYYAFNPETEKLERKRIKLNHINSKTERRKYAVELIKRLNENLFQGWNPFIDPEAKKSYEKLSDAIKHFIRINEKKLQDDVIREETFKDYVSYLGNLQTWVSKKFGDIYVYKLDKDIITKFLEHIYIERNRTAQTRNNYLNMFRVFAGFLVENNYLKYKVTDGINTLRKGKKQRTVIERHDMQRIRDYLTKHNPWYLLACEFEYYTMIRPKELSHVKIKDISFANATVFVGCETAKNRKDAVVTLPDVLTKKIIELEIHNFPSNYYIFSDDFKPGEKRKSEKQFRDYWLKLRKILKLPANYKFYSFKDTGITDMLMNTKNPLVVRDQARHSNISITDIYTPKNLRKGNEQIKNSDLVIKYRFSIFA